MIEMSSWISRSKLCHFSWILHRRSRDVVEQCELKSEERTREIVFVVIVVAMFFVRTEVFLFSPFQQWATILFFILLSKSRSNGICDRCLEHRFSPFLLPTETDEDVFVRFLMLKRKKLNVTHWPKREKRKNNWNYTDGFALFFF